MNDGDIDRAIDVATRAMMAREPGHGLSRDVIARVRGGAAPQRLPLRWVVAAAATVMCAAVAVSLIGRVPVSAVRLPSELQLAVAQGAVIPVVPAHALHETPSRVSFVAGNPGRVAPRSTLPPADVSTIEPIETQVITVTAIDVPQLQRETTSIEAIDIEPLTIQPLAASND